MYFVTRAKQGERLESVRDLSVRELSRELSVTMDNGLNKKKGHSTIIRVLVLQSLSYVSRMYNNFCVKITCVSVKRNGNFDL